MDHRGGKLNLNLNLNTLLSIEPSQPLIDWDQVGYPLLEFHEGNFLLCRDYLISSSVETSRLVETVVLSVFPC